ncbi:MBOAT family O-acyltransferase [Flavipsychrobacter stenotrophus]|nr:MBOAT family O-acyltransferase [Flavipsychrobacter stenotrophus]
MLSTIIDYTFGILIHTKKNKKLYLWLSIFNNLAVLGVFKYYNFFAHSFQDMVANIGFHVDPYFLAIVLPVGISFYTFHGMSYVFDICRERSVPERNFVDYSLFVCFFPLLVAGPIERASHLLPQVVKKRNFDYKQSVHGLRLMLWGMFKKVVIADGLAPSVNSIYADYSHMSGLSLLIGAFYFAFQIYADFSGYSDIARGTAKLFGFELLINFRFPYFSRDIAEFWRRWHISLSSWFRDYLYIPLGGSKNGLAKSVRNTFIIFIVSGFWHGANWTFIIWGALHALYFLPLLLGNKNRRNTGEIAPGRFLPGIREGFQMLLTFGMVCLAWIFFRAANFSEAIHYISSIFTNKFRSGMEVKQFIAPYVFPVIGFMLLIEWLSRNSDVDAFFDTISNKTLRYSTYFLIFFIILMFGSFQKASFIYFQF